MTQTDDPYESKARLGNMIRAANRAAVHDDARIPELRRLNDIAVSESFVNMLADAGCMITRIPK